MALTVDEWHVKLKKFVPSWYFAKNKADGGLTDALFYCMATMIQQAEKDMADQFDATFLTRATLPILDLEGDERNIDRLAGELDPQYVNRIQRVTSNTDYTDILAAINKILLVTPAKIIEAPYGNPYFSRGCYYSRDSYYCAFKNNFFIVVIPQQVHQPYSFFSRSYFFSRSNFYGTTQTPEVIMNSIVALVNSMKAFGVLWRLYESNNFSV